MIVSNMSSVVDSAGRVVDPRSTVDRDLADPTVGSASRAIFPPEVYEYDDKNKNIKYYNYYPTSRQLNVTTVSSHRYSVMRLSFSKHKKGLQPSSSDVDETVGLVGRQRAEGSSPSVGTSESVGSDVVVENAIPLKIESAVSLEDVKGW